MVPRAFTPRIRSAMLVCVGAWAATGGLGCYALATNPDWTVQGMAQSAPTRIAAQEAEYERQREEERNAPTTIGARHVLVMHDGSERKPETVQRTREQALERAKEALAKLDGGTAFEDVVTEYSDEPGAADRGGDLGVFERSKMIKGFGDAAFALDVGEISDIVETPFGFHIIQRTE